MKPQDKIAIDNLRMEGKSAGDISIALNLSINTVRSHIRRHPDIPNARRCKTCGAFVAQPTGRREKKFCSDKCRNLWWNSHTEQINKKAYYTLVCKECGKEFESYGNNRRKYCLPSVLPYRPQSKIRMTPRVLCFTTPRRDLLKSS